MNECGEDPLSCLLSIMRKLRDPQTGCPWDIEQDFASIAPYTIEEAYEVDDAIQRNDMAALREELGDLLLQVVYHSQIAAERDLFTFDDVTSAIADKMVRRHPHVFGAAPSRDVPAQRVAWEEQKKNERDTGGTAGGALAGVAVALPALMRAQKLQRRAGRTGFDWPDARGASNKISEELAEVTAATTGQDRHEEIGDLLFSVVNLARHLDIDAEHALRDANAKFERRFAAMESAHGHPLDGLAIETMEGLWADAKAAEPS